MQSFIISVIRPAIISATVFTIVFYYYLLPRSGETSSGEDDGICNKFRFSGSGFCSPIVVQNQSPRILTKERGIWGN